MHQEALIIISAILILFLWGSYMLYGHENFDLESYLRPNYESGANMLRGDLPIQPVHHSWFNTPYGPSDLVHGFFENQ